MQKTLSAKKVAIIIISALAIGFIIGAFILPNRAKAGTPDKVLKIKTSAICDMCKARIETGMKKIKGINKTVLDVKSKVLTVNYNPDKISPDEIRDAVNKIGYDADSQSADPKAYKMLPKCCRKP